MLKMNDVNSLPTRFVEVVDGENTNFFQT